MGYSKHKNPYHNLMHAADVTQTVHYLLYKTGVAVSADRNSNYMTDGVLLEAVPIQMRLSP